MLRSHTLVDCESTMKTFARTLQSHPLTTTVAAASEGLLVDLSRSVEAILRDDQFPGVAIYVVGSLGRKEIGPTSDVDIYAVSRDELSPGSGESFFPSVIAGLRSRLGPGATVDQKCLRVFSRHKLARMIGTSSDDYENTLTARALLLLESQALGNPSDYLLSIETLASGYFAERTHRAGEFRAAFLLDDLMRFWKTLCVNFEVASYNGSRPVALKSIVLRFSRVLTVFSTILNIMAKRDFCESDLVGLVPLSPWERVARALDRINNRSLLRPFQEALDMYYSFLLLKQRPDIAQILESDTELRNDYLAEGDRFSDFFYQLVCGPNVDAKLRKFLII